MLNIYDWSCMYNLQLFKRKMPQKISSYAVDFWSTSSKTGQGWQPPPCTSHSCCELDRESDLAWREGKKNNKKKINPWDYFQLDKFLGLVHSKASQTAVPVQLRRVTCCDGSRRCWRLYFMKSVSRLSTIWARLDSKNGWSAKWPVNGFTLQS